jgi:hypothetical protein
MPWRGRSTAGTPTEPSVSKSCCFHGAGKRTPCHGSVAAPRASSTRSSSIGLTSSLPCSTVGSASRPAKPYRAPPRRSNALTTTGSPCTYGSRTSRSCGTLISPKLEALREFKQSLEPLGLLGTYASPDDLVFKVRQAIESDLSVLNLGPVAQRRRPASAVLRAEYEYEREPHTDSRGRTKLRTRRERITVCNTGTATASDVVLMIAPLGEGDAPESRYDESPTILPEGQYSWPLFTTFGDSRSLELTITWQEDGEERSETQHLALI